MIHELGIANLGVIHDATLPLAPGFTAITGETGAGKTMVVSALGLLCGARADAGQVRTGATAARVQGIWRIAADSALAERVADLGGIIEEDELILSRTVSKEGRSRAVVGGSAAPASALGELASQLVVVHGQSDQQRLRSTAAQRDVVDRFGGAAVRAALEQYRTIYRQVAAYQEEYDTLTTERDARLREAAELRHAVDEISAAAPEPGEDEALATRADVLTHQELLRDTTAHAIALLSAEGEVGAPGARECIDQVRRELERAAAVDPQLAQCVEQAATLGYLIDDLTTELARYRDAHEESDPNELESVQQRRAVLGDLLRKYGATLEEVREYEQSASQRLLVLDGDDDRIVALATLLTDATAELHAAATELSRLRAAAGERLATLVTRELAALAMPDAALLVQCTPLERPALHGADEVVLLLQPHRGAPPRPLGKGASGGELSRVMLALEVVVAGVDPVPTFIFDEVDAGVGGAAALEIGRRLARLAETSQVIVVTHLAQVAAFATQHLNVVKDRSGDFTETSVRVLAGDERLAEIARLLSGMSDSANALSHAQELLDLAHG